MIVAHVRRDGKAQHTSAKVHRTLTVNADGSYALNNLDNLRPEERRILRPTAAQPNTPDGGCDGQQR